MSAEQLSYASIKPFLDTTQNRLSKIFSYTGLWIGVLLLLCAAQIFININQLLQEKNPRNDGFDFISVTKTITDQNMGSDNSFTDAEIKELRSKEFIIDAAPLTSNQFRAKASAGSIIPFSTDLFLESIQNNFLDTIPPSFIWQEGQLDVPIIFSADFLEMYNVFAPAQDLPQLSQTSISAVNIILECYGPAGTKHFRGHIVGVSDRINSVLVPENFLQWANNTFGNTSKAPPARVFIKTKDANNPAFLQFLEVKKYHINKDKTKFGRVKQVLQAVVSGLGGFAILIILLAMMLFSFYLQLMVSKSRDNIRLLVQLGYSPGWLGKTVTKKWIPAYIVIILLAISVASIFQYIFYKNFTVNLDPVLHWSVWTITLVLLLLCVTVNYVIIKKLLQRL